MIPHFIAQGIYHVKVFFLITSENAAHVRRGQDLIEKQRLAKPRDLQPLLPKPR